MRPIRKTVAAATVGDWIPLDRNAESPIGFTVKPQTGTAGGTYSVNFTESEIQRGMVVYGITRSTTTLTIPLVNHGLSTADDIVIVGSPEGFVDGNYRVASVVSADSITVTVADSGLALFAAEIIPIVVDTVTDFSAVSGLLSGNLFASVTAVRLNNASEPDIKHDILLNQQAS